MLRAFHTSKINLSSLGQFLGQTPPEAPREHGAERRSRLRFCCYREGPLPLQTCVPTFSALFQFHLLTALRVAPENKKKKISSPMLSFQGFPGWGRGAVFSWPVSQAPLDLSAFEGWGEGCSVNSFFLIFFFIVGGSTNLSNMGKLAPCRARALWQEEIFASPFSGICLSKEEEKFLSESPDLHPERLKSVTPYRILFWELGRSAKKARETSRPSEQPNLLCL